MIKKLSKIFLYSFLAVILVAIGTALFTQTPLFRKTLRSTFYTYLASELNADIYIGEINGNLFSGFTVDTVMMYIDGAPFLEAGKLNVQYNALDLLRNKISIDTLTLENPSINLTRWKNGDWNVNHLAKNPSLKDSTESTLLITARRVRISNARFHLTDSTGEYDKSIVDRNGKPSINYHNILLEKVNIDLRGKYSEKEIDVTVTDFSFLSLQQNFMLAKLSANVRHTKQQTSVKDLTIITPDSRIKTSVSIDNIDAFAISDLIDLRRSQVSLTIFPSNILSRDIQVFLPSLDFIEGNIIFEGEMEGNFENVSVKRLNTKFGTSSISLSGTVSNVYKPEDLRLNIVSSNSTINPDDVPTLMPYFNIPNYKNLGLITLDFQFVGKPLDFLAISKIKSAAGTVTVDGQMVITEENIHYKGILAGNDVNFEKIFATNELTSRLNTRIFIEGEGVSLDKLNAEATIEIDSSSFRNIPLNATSVSIKAHEKKFNSDIALRSPDGNITLKTSIDFTDQNLPEYALSGIIRGLNLAPILQDNFYTSNISFDIDRFGKGLSLFDNYSDTKIDIHESNFNGIPFDSAQIIVKWLKDSTNNDILTVQSPLVDGQIKGKFTIKDIVNNVQTHLAGLNKIYTYQRGIIDSTIHLVLDSLPDNSSIPLRESSLSYDLNLKNLKPISTFFRFPELDLVGTAKGSIQSDTVHSSSSGIIQLAHGSYADTSAHIGATNVSLDYALKNISLPELISPIDPLNMTVRFNGDELTVNKTSFRLMQLNFDFNNQKGKYFVATDIDTMLTAAVEGEIEVSDLLNRFTISRLNAKYQGLAIQNSGPFIATETRDGFIIDSSIFIRGDEEFFIKGKYDYRGAIMVDASITNFALSDIFFVNTSPEFRQQAFALGGTIDAAVKITGTVENPIILSQMEGKDISYRNSNFGNLDVALNYAKKKAGIKIELSNEQKIDTATSFNLEGVVPIDLSFTDVDNRTRFQGMDIRLTAGNLPVEMFDIFIPEIDRMKGKADGMIDITGSLSEPLMAGSLRVRDGSFRLEMSGIEYTVAGKIVLDSQRMKFPEFKISNMKKDYSDGVVSVGGYILLKGFAPSEYHLTMNGELLVLTENSRAANQSFFGSLITRTGQNGLKFEGTFERSRVIGEVLVQEAFITFPPTQQSASFSSARFDDVVFVDDTSRSIVDTTLVKKILQMISPTLKAKDGERTFLDGFGYELTIQTQGNVSVKMVFNAEATAYEELSAELNGKMVLKKDESGQQLTGTINVGEGSNYKFYKEFKATGTLTFVGDAQNPQLNILAKYEGTHCKKPDPETGNCAEAIDIEKVVVSLEITGNRFNPKLKIGLATVDQNDREIPRLGDVENDAIAFLLTSSSGESGRFREELSLYDRNRLGNQLTEAIGGTFINSLLSGVVMDFIKENNIPFVKRVEVRNVTSETDINITGEFMDAVINFGGRVFKDVNNTNISVQMPVLGKQNRNFMFEVEKKTENYDYSIQARTILGARLFYRFTF
ncbi:MAG: hypothetical protein WDA22_15695 [Bacteroidota bacterium]